MNTEDKIKRLRKKVIARDLTIRYLLMKMKKLSNDLKHSQTLSDNKPYIENLTKELDRLYDNHKDDYGAVGQRSLSELSGRAK